MIIGDAETRGGVAPAGGAAAEDEDEMPSLENTNFEKEAAK